MNVIELRRKYTITVQTPAGERSLTVEATGIRDALVATSNELEREGIRNWSLIGTVRPAR